MRIAVIGGTGLVGRHCVEVAHAIGHDVVVVARSRGIDVTTGQGLDSALAGVESVIDASSFVVGNASEVFATAARNLAASEKKANVKHHVLLSIVGLDRFKGNEHMAGKRAQEAIVLASGVPATIQRATQFHDFGGMAVDWFKKGGVAVVPPALVQPVAVVDLANVLVEVASGKPLGCAADLAGPQPEDLFDMAKRTIAARGENTRLIPGWRGGIYTEDAAGDVLMPGPGARLATTTFEQWLNIQPAGNAR